MRDGIRRCRPVFVAGGELDLYTESKWDLMQTEPVMSAHGAFTSVRGNVLRIRSGEGRLGLLLQNTSEADSGMTSFYSSLCLRACFRRIV